MFRLRLEELGVMDPRMVPKPAKGWDSAFAKKTLDWGSPACCIEEEDSTGFEASEPVNYGKFRIVESPLMRNIRIEVSCLNKQDLKADLAKVLEDGGSIGIDFSWGIIIGRKNC